MNGFGFALGFAEGLLRALMQPPTYGISVWFLAWVFTWSGIVKLRRPVLAAMAMVDFGVVQRVEPRLGFTLGMAELLLAYLLAVGVLPHLVLFITATLLWFFTFLITRSLISGDRFACFCFGDMDSPLSRVTLVRTTTLALLASLLAYSTTPSLIRGWLIDTEFLQGSVALSFLGAIALTSYLPRLLRWNSDLTKFVRHQKREVER